MSIAIGRQLLGPASALPADAASRPDADRLKLAELAHEFEASLLVQMVRQMRQSLLSDEEEGLGNATMTDTLDVELARQLAAQGGIGLGRVIEKAMEKLAGAGSAGARSAQSGERLRYVDFSTPQSPVSMSTRPEDASGGAEPLVLADSSQAVALPGLALPLAGGVNSAYGWREDPFHGARKFHAGMDFRAAYGREVPASGTGRVVFAGERGAYGQMVVVDHGGGLETRYAHLSSVMVAVGQELAQGEVVGRVGQTGRATGPHLHFEVLMNGHRVDPMQVAERLPAQLKNVAADDD